MIRKRVSLFGSALREISLGATTSVRFISAVPHVIQTQEPGLREVEASGIRLLMGVTSRATQNGTPLALNVFLQQKDSTETWRDVAGAAFTAVVTATAYETLEIYPGVDHTVTPPRKSMLLPYPLRIVAKLNGSITATPGTTFFVDAELYS